MDVVALGAGLPEPFYQNSPLQEGSVRAGGRGTNGDLVPSADASLELPTSSVRDRLELSGDSLLYYSSQEFAFRDSALQVRSDGTYFYRQVSLEARQDILVTLNLGPGGAANIDLEAVQAQLEGIVRELQEGFQDSLRGLVESLRSRQPVASPSPILPVEELLTDDVKALLSEYLVLIRQLADPASQKFWSAKQSQRRYARDSTCAVVLIEHRLKPLDYLWMVGGVCS